MVLHDTFSRRKALAVPVLAMAAAGHVMRYLSSPRSMQRLSGCIRQIAPRIRVDPDIHSEPVRRAVEELAPDLGLVYGGPILKPELFEIPRLGTLGIHHGKLPEYRGKKTTFWALYNREREAWVTIQKINAGLDTGSILAEGRVPAHGRSLRAVWSNLEELGLELFTTTVVNYGKGKIQTQEPAGKKGKLYRDPRTSDLLRYFFRRLHLRQHSSRLTGDTK